MASGARHVLVAAIVVGATAIGAFTVDADIEGTTFTSKEHNVRMNVPRGWRNNDQVSYPGVLVRMFKTNPAGTMILAVDDLPEKIDPTCVARQTTTGEGVVVEEELPLVVQIACDQARRLRALGFDVATIKEGDRPVFDYASGTRMLRQGVVLIDDRVFTLILSATTGDTRAQHGRTFEKSLRSLRALSAEERAAAGVTADGGVPGDGGALDAGPAGDAGAPP